MSPFTLTRTCSRISPWSETVRPRATSATDVTTCLIICNSLEFNILTQRSEQLCQTVEHAAFGARVLLRLLEDFLFGESGSDNPGSGPRRPPGCFFAPVG